MKYFGYLLRFVIVPLVIIRLLIRLDRQRNVSPPTHMQNWPEESVLLGHVAIAVAYTTPWDNYLVASKIWWYDPKLVTGHTIGWVPIEEYSFFVLQSILTGSWLQFIMPYFPAEASTSSDTLVDRSAVTGGLGMLWLASCYGLVRKYEKTHYLDLILAWSLPPIMLQTLFGGDILWRNRKLLLATIVPSTLYLGLADSMAIESGTWTINHEKIIGREVIKNLPFEEFVFFFVTNVLLAFGITLVQSKDSEERLPTCLKQPYLQIKHKLFRS